MNFYILAFLAAAYNPAILRSTAKPTDNNPARPDVDASVTSSTKRNIFVIARVYQYAEEKFAKQKKSLRTGGDGNKKTGPLSGDGLKDNNNTNVDKVNISQTKTTTTTKTTKFIEQAPTDETQNSKTVPTTYTDKDEEDDFWPCLTTDKPSRTVEPLEFTEQGPTDEVPMTTTTTTTTTTKESLENSTKIPKEEDTNSTCNCSCNEDAKDTKNENKTGTEGSIDPRILFNFKPPVTSLENDELHYQLADYIIKFVFKHYPELQIPQLAKVLANGTTHRAYSGMIMEFQQPNNFDILVTDSYSQVNDGSTRKIEQYPSLYQCSKAIRYCSVNPKFCQYQEGDYDTNIIITVPHGGNFKPEHLKERSAGCYDNQHCVYVHDCEQYGGVKDENRCGVETYPNSNSRDIALLLADQIKNATGQRPHIVIMELHHSLIDVDAFEAEGTFGDGQMKTTWYDFHNFVSIAKQKIKGRGLLLDIHTHSKTHGLVELGYAVVTSQFEQDQVDPNNSSMKSLADYVKVPFEEILRGRSSLGDLLQERNIEAFPSPAFMKRGARMFEDKQTIVKLYGSLYGGLIDAIRISTPKKYYTETEIEEYTTLLSSALKEFMDLNYVHRGYIP